MPYILCALECQVLIFNDLSRHGTRRVWAKSRIAHPQDSHRSGRDRSLHRRWPVELAAVTADGPPRLAQITRDNMGWRTNLLFDCFAAIAASVMRSHLAEPEERRQNGQNTASTFDTAGRLLAQPHTIGGNPLDAVGYALNGNGWRTAIARPEER